MKSALLALVIFALAGLGYWALVPHGKIAGPPPDPNAGLSLYEEADPAVVFKKAFWKYPTAQDQIVHAERLEWSGDGGLKKWHWFIQVSPSTELAAYLEKNPFMLIPSEAPHLESTPDWFPTEFPDFEIFRSDNGSMTFLWDRTHNTLFATDSGGGFSPGVVLNTPSSPSP